MICPQCGTENQPKFKFCVKCGSNLENPQEINIEQVDMGGYHSEDEPQSGGFKLSGGTFKISDNAPVASSSDLYTADELNDTDEEFDFSDIDEPFIPKLDTGRVTLPEQAVHPQQPNVYGAPMQQNMAGGAMGGMQPHIGAMPQMNGMPQQPMGGAVPQMGGMPQPQAGMPQQPMNGMPQAGMMQPQIIGYDQSGMPIYGQAPMMYAQPQIIGYDQNGMPIYGQAPMMYAQPQIIGYDQNGMPIYGQAPMMYAQPQIIGYDQSGMPIYGQPQPMQQPMGGAVPPMGGMPQMNGMPQQPMGGTVPQMGGMPQMGTMPRQQAAPAPRQPAEDKNKVKVPDNFWEFFDGGKATEHAEPADDFFGKRSGNMGDVSAADLDMSRLKKFERKKNSYMNAAPLADAAELAPHTDAKYNKLYMKNTAEVNADDLQAKVQQAPQDIMGHTKEVNADDLEAHEERNEAWSLMSETDEANADDLEAYVPEHKEAIMSQADHAVESMPKKKTTYNDEIDAIELPEYMQARKAVKDETPEIPGLPEL